MKKRNTRILTVLLALTMLAMLFAACGGSPSGSGDSGTTTQPDNGAGSTAAPTDDVKPVEFKLSIHNSSTSLSTQVVQQLADATEEATEGRVKITIYADSVLGPPTDGLTMLDTGVCDILWTTSSFFAEQFPITEIFTMPMLNPGDVYELTHSMWDLYEAHPEYYAEFDGYYPLAMYVGGQGVFAVNKELGSLADLKGLTLRVVSGPLNTMAQAFGANCVTMAPNDLYLSMEKGVIDGFMFNLEGIQAYNLHDVVQYAYCFGNSTWDNNILVLMSEGSWDKISAADQEILNAIWGREGSQTLVKALYDNSQLAVEAFGDRLITIESGEFYDELEALAESSIEEYLSQRTTAERPMDEALAFVKERIEFYKAQ